MLASLPMPAHGSKGLAEHSMGSDFESKVVQGPANVGRRRIAHARRSLCLHVALTESGGAQVQLTLQAAKHDNPALRGKESHGAGF